MLGTIIADISRTKYSRGAHGLSADGILSIAVSEWLLNGNLESKDNLKEFLSQWKRKHVLEPGPYSYTNDNPILAAVPIGLWASDIGQARDTARFVATAVYPTKMRIDGTEAVAAAVFMADRGADKGENRHYLEREFNCDLSGHDQHEDDERLSRGRLAVESALNLFFHGTSFRQTLKTAIAENESDLVTSIACALAEAYYGIPFLMRRRALRNLPEDIRTAVIGIRNHRKLRKSAPTCARIW